MDRSLITENDIRDYLLGRVSDEERLAAFEELLFSDEEFCAMAEAAEDTLIDEHISGRLNDADREDFLNSLTNNRRRREKTAISSMLKAKATAKMAVPERVSVFDSIKAAFQRPAFAAGFALLLVAIIAVSYFVLRPKNGELADLKSIYNKQRPTESRISEFDYAPLVTTRGAAEEREATRLRRIELTLIEATERTPDGRSFHALGIFYLTQQKFPLAIDAFNRSLKLDQNNARTLNDLGSAYFESARADSSENRFKTLAMALENFSKAVSIDAKFAAALFNRSLCLQELRLTNEARESWQQYLKLDATSGWADEARKNLEKLEQTSGSAKTKEEALADAIDAYKNKDEAAAWQIASQTREMITGVWIPGQLTRKFLEAKIRGDDAAANDAIGALRYIGELERSKNADFFVSEMADFYARTTKPDKLLAASDDLFGGFMQINTRDIGKAKESFTTSRNAFLNAGDKWNAMIADLWLAHGLSDHSGITEGDEILKRLIAVCEKGKYKWLSLAASDWIANNQLLRNEIGRSTAQNVRNLQLADQLSDTAMRTKVLLVLAYNYGEVGEVNRSIELIGRMKTIENSYLHNDVRSWQQNFFPASIVGKLGLVHAADHFAQEALFDARNSSLKGSQAVDDTLRLLIELNRRNGDLTAALAYAAESQKLANETIDPVFRAKLSRYALEQTADLRRETGDHELAIAAYDEASKLRSADSEVEIDAYQIEKGKLLSLIALGRQNEADQQFARTLEMSESFRSKILDETSRLAFYETEQEVYEAAVTNALAKSDPRAAFDLTEISRARNLLDFVEGERSLAQLQNEFPTVAQPSRLSEIQSSIPANVQIVEYLLLRDRLVVWYVTNEKFEFVETAVEGSDVDAKVGQFLDTAINEKDRPENLTPISTSLYTTLIEPVLPHLDKNKQLVIIPDRSLNKLPFAALLSPSTNHYLIEELALSYSPSTNILVRLSELAAKRSDKLDKIAVVGNPKFDRMANPGIEDLPAAGDEAVRVAGLYSSNDLLVGDKAVKKEVLAKLTSSPIFHFAGHYVANTLSQPNSRLILAPSSEDGDLRLAELAKTRLNMTKFVVLSACDTNAERVFSGEGATGIAQKFLAIGSPLVVAGNWKVDSDLTRDLMIAFHQNRTKLGLNVADALRQAQLGLMHSADGNVRPPYFWAAFSAVGGATSY